MEGMKTMKAVAEALRLIFAEVTIMTHKVCHPP